MENLVETSYQAFQQTIFQLALLLGPGILLGFLMNLISRRMEKSFIKLIGTKFYIWGFAGIGTIVHELGHAIMCVIFCHRIRDISLFNPTAKGGKVGYVSHSYSRGNPYQLIGNFFIGIGPIISGTLVIYGATSLLLDYSFFGFFDSISFSGIDLFSSQNLLIEIFDKSWSFTKRFFQISFLTDWKFYLFLYIALSVGSNITLSPPDVKGAWSGFLATIIFLFLFNLLALHQDINLSWINLRYISSYTTVFYSIMIFALVLNLVLMIPLSIFSALKD